jgi:energy-coupling factor transporter transmembrane protein EcfT
MFWHYILDFFDNIRHSSESKLRYYFFMVLLMVLLYLIGWRSYIGILVIVLCLQLVADLFFPDYNEWRWVKFAKLAIIVIVGGAFLVFAYHVSIMQYVE